MKRKLLTTTLLLLAFLFSGCACQHEWTEADCLNPQVCTKCQETGTEALGHSWVEATCTAAETCTRCGETQGEPIDHTFGDWTFGDTHMTHTCTSCGLEETKELDRGLYLETLLPGYWEGYCLFHGEDIYSAYDFSQPLDMLYFGENRTASGNINTEDVTGTWEFLEYSEDEKGNNYLFSLNAGDEFNWTLLFSQQEDANLLYILYPNGDQILLSDNDALAETIAAAGSWGVEGPGSMYSLTFHPDRTVTGCLDQEFQGTWQLMYQEELGGMEDYMTDARYCGLYIRYTMGGEEVIMQVTITPSRANMYDTRVEEFTPGQLSLRYNNAHYTFQPMDAQEISNKNRAMQEGPSMLLGTWSSLYWRKFGNGSYTDKTIPGYSVTFNSDNTFTACVGKERTGTWSYVSEWSNSNDPSSGSHGYSLKFDDENYFYRADLYYNDGQMPELRFWGRTTYSSDLKILFLGRLTERDNQVLQNLMGDWTSTQESINNHVTGESSQIAITDYHFTFREDGTFTGYDGTDLQGHWKLARIFYNDDNSRSYYFDLNEDGSGSPYDIIIYDHGDEMYVEYRETRADFQRWLRLKQYSQEELDAVALGPTIPIGEWISTAVTRYQNDSDNDEHIETSEYSITVFEDGTFTANLDITIQGTWRFQEYRPDSGYDFFFDFPGKSQYGPRTFYVSKENDFLSIRLMDQDQEAFYQMKRK